LRRRAGELWEAFVDRGRQIKVILSESQKVPIEPFAFSSG
jgi:hypothetical protein